MIKATVKRLRVPIKVNEDEITCIDFSSCFALHRHIPCLSLEGSP